MTDDMQRAREFVSDFLSTRGWAGQIAADVLAKAPHDVRISGADAIELVTAALMAAPQGYRLVPVEATDAMVEAAADAYMPFGDMWMAIQSAMMAGDISK